MKSAAFSPAHITGFFKIHKSGSTGAGITLEDGMTTAINSKSSKDSIHINGKKSNAPVSKNVINKYKELAGKFTVNVNHKTRIPIGYGLGMSAAGALSLSLALSDCLGIVSVKEAKKIAHLAEIECKTGLGGVIAESTGGLVIRKKPGSFKYVEKIYTSGTVACSFFSPINTKTIITNTNWKNKLNRFGDFCINEFQRAKSLEGFISLSRHFALETGLTSKAIHEIILENKNCSMAMLGRTIFSLNNFKTSRNFLVSKIGNKGAYII
ncbi:pantothenate kinase [Candidatus Micrarchaeota archaeon]|nr:pantothenate kinase [Candidatus Micrarchaeota archaeon]